MLQLRALRNSHGSGSSSGSSRSSNGGGKSGSNGRHAFAAVDSKVGSSGGKVSGSSSGRPSSWKVRWLRRLRVVLLAVAAYGACLLCARKVFHVAEECPELLDCDSTDVEGFFWDHTSLLAPATYSDSGDDDDDWAGAAAAALEPEFDDDGNVVVRGGHLLEARTGEGPHKPESCSQLCRDVPGCAFWMYKKESKHGYCKLWRIDQSPCMRSRSFILPLPHPHFSRSRYARKGYLVGGNCRSASSSSSSSLAAAARSARLQRKRKKRRKGVGGASVEEAQLITADELVAGECPALTCNSATPGFVYDHKARGHLKETTTGSGPRRPFTCFVACIRTPGCSVWMYEMRSQRGYCKMWTREQSPCQPSDPFDAKTAHFMAKTSHGSFVVGAGCEKVARRIKPSRA